MARDPIIPPMDLAPEELARRLMQPPREKKEDTPKPAQQDDAVAHQP